ncbi:hypothetical protein [Selenomonas sp.]|uniref:hypothetical protein n=1 Tax=Selenomonas sp. TaxID=2053611 RepID=UPI003FA2244C
MWYVFDNKGACISSCDSEPNTADLATRGETAIENAVHYSIYQIHLVDGKIKKKPAAESPIITPTEPPVDTERLAVYEAMAAQDERIASYAERITALEVALKAKGGESK